MFNFSFRVVAKFEKLGLKRTFLFVKNKVFN